MASERQVRLHLSTRAVMVPAEGGLGAVRYAGVTVMRLEDGDVVEHEWVPVGAAPNYADDEALIAAWHAALQWSLVAD